MQLPSRIFRTASPRRSGPRWRQVSAGSTKQCHSKPLSAIFRQHTTSHRSLRHIHTKRTCCIREPVGECPHPCSEPANMGNHRGGRQKVMKGPVPLKRWVSTFCGLKFHPFSTPYPRTVRQSRTTQHSSSNRWNPWGETPRDHVELRCHCTNCATNAFTLFAKRSPGSRPSSVPVSHHHSRAPCHKHDKN